MHRQVERKARNIPQEVGVVGVLDFVKKICKMRWSTVSSGNNE